MAMQKKFDFDMEDVGGRKTIIVLCVDTSNSLYGWQREVNSAIKAFFAELDKEPKARYGTEVAVVTYDTKPRIHVNFTTEKAEITPITIPAHNPTGGWTDIGEALDFSIDLAIEEWKKLKSKGVPVYLPWVILFTDGKPENKEKNAIEKLLAASERLKSYEFPQKKNDKILFIGIGVGDNVDVGLMRNISAHGKVRYLHANNFSMLSQLFKFVGATTVTNVGRDNYIDSTQSFSFQAPKSDPIDMSNGGFGNMEQSPVFSGGEGLFNGANSPIQNQTGPIYPDSPANNSSSVFSEPVFYSSSADNLAVTNSEPPSKPVGSTDLDSLLEEMMRISTSNASFD